MDVGDKRFAPAQNVGNVECNIQIMLSSFVHSPMRAHSNRARGSTSNLRQDQPAGCAMQNPLSSSGTALQAESRSEHNAQALTNPLTRNSRSADPADMDPEPVDAPETHEQIEVPPKPDDLHGNKHQDAASPGKDANVGVSVDEAPRKDDDQERPTSANPSIESRATTTPTTTPLASKPVPDTINNGSKLHEIERRQAAESLLILNQSKQLKRKRPVPGNAGRRASLAKQNEKSDEIEYLGTRRTSGHRPLVPRQQAPRAKDKRGSAEQERRMLDVRNSSLSNRLNQHANPVGSLASGVPLRNEDLVLLSRLGLIGQPAVRAPPDALYYSPAHYAHPAARPSNGPSGCPTAELRHGTHHGQHLGQGPVVGWNIETNGYLRDWSRSVEAPPPTSQSALFPWSNAELVPTDLYAHPRRPESALSNVWPRTPLPHASSPRPGSARPASMSRNLVLPSPTHASDMHYASLPPSFGALYLARGVDGNRSRLVESSNRARSLAEAHAVANLHQRLKVDHWKSRHLQKWCSLGIVHDGSGDHFADRLPKLILCQTVPTGQKEAEAPVAVAESLNTKVEAVGAQDSPTTGEGEESREDVAYKLPGDIQ
ncbi:hypothetical protein CERZMDRAFT_84277 [Cercospora zeae-maydis SCOH1-5]|uniref:Uncharacterized protein n=1 Tax=Cercospora zeae-maydis SCOH1-5 TaxID=717836 RepID=A0A6A6FGS8_9PEZI|nr:hypothetical protein CERZMDRAFT_84277 [Cercospora zeae-maydis SCOH1-5]